MSITQGMGVEDVERLGRSIQSQSERLETLLAEVSKRVQNTSWVGQDAERFKKQWWPEHQSKLSEIAKGLHGFGQSALNNASEQREASSAGGSHVNGNASVGDPGSGSGGAPSTGPAEGQAIPAAAGAGAVPPWFEPANRAHAATGSSPAWNEGYQCVDWAVKRRQHLGLPVASNDGWAMAETNHGSSAVVPQFGAIASYGDESSGHVMIVEEVFDGGNKIRVSEMNVGDNRWWISTADEFRSNRVFERVNGGWSDGVNGIKNIKFAN